MTGWVLSLSVPFETVPMFEAALESLGGALVQDQKSPNTALQLYLEEEPERDAITALLAAAATAAGIAVPGFECQPLPAVDWVAESHKALPPISAGRLYVHGSHVTEPPPAASIPILIEAAMAFGTGRHESTKGCLLALGGLAKLLKVGRALDMGCGSGLLAIAMAHLWHCPVLAVDNDRKAVAVARENAALNAVSAWVRCAWSEGYRGATIARQGPYDLIAANILARPLRAMAPDLTRSLAPGGFAVLSGLLSSQQQGVLAAHRAQGLHLAGRITLGDWTTLVLRRRRS